MLFDRERPVVARVRGGRPRQQVAKEEDRGEGFERRRRRHIRQRCHQIDEEDVDEGRRQYAKGAAQIKPLEADATRTRFFVEQARADEKAADAEKDIDAVMAVVEDRKPRNGRRRAVIADDHQHGDGAPAVQRRDVVGSPLLHTSRKGEQCS